MKSGQLDEQEILTQHPFAALQANEERQRNLLHEYEQGLCYLDSAVSIFKHEIVEMHGSKAMNDLVQSRT